MSVITFQPVATSPATDTARARSNRELGQEDFFRLLTVQMQQQDPFEPVDNKEMIAQMAQFSSLSGVKAMNETLGAISDKLDALIAAQSPENAAPAAMAQAMNGA
ncbi:MAG: flagellar hook assembly protein FlgD [Sphingomonadaceae bacterium]